ncbi:MAG: hypothetical protein KDK54_13180 [Leptospiraceae bacterium]|nr:hypothetical protein [Leptospiraceae bacterium]
MRKIEALLLDTTGIQDYIYSSNKLKSIIGASYIIKTLYSNSTLTETLKEVLGYDPDLNEWQKNTDVKIFKENKKFEVGYIGGGNALFFFQLDENEKSNAERFMRIWSTRLLSSYPGISVVPAYRIVETEEELTQESNFKKFLTEIFQSLKDNKNTYQPINTFLNTGINLPCKLTDQPSSFYYEGHHQDEESEYLSSQVITKLNSSQTANQKLISDLEDILNSKYTFHTNMEKLGQKKNEKNFLSVIHIDGNGIGNLFREQKSLKELRNLSIQIDRIVQNSFRKLIDEFVQTHPENNPDLKLEKEDGMYVLPIRPILMSGDDITAVTEGRLGLSISERWIELLNEYSKKENLSLSFCAGVSVFNTNFPFRRAYDLSNDACREAKKVSRREDENDEKNWIDFHIQYSGYSGPLSEVRKQFLTIGGNLIARPYQINGNNDNSFQSLKSDAQKMKKNVPASILHELKDNLWKHRSEREFFLNVNQSRKTPIPFDSFILNESYSGRLYPDDSDKRDSKNKTHLFDIIEMTEFYLDWKGGR